ncbi:MAG: hypothetical protein QME66_04845 [Candidatus Eisenbacteria bacterium]|nr:hypothetical protein [Candidatus Eisenbacteria bacterium]
MDSERPHCQQEEPEKPRRVGKEELVGKVLLLIAVLSVLGFLIYSFFPFYKMSERFEGGMSKVFYIPLGMAFVALFLLRRALTLFREIKNRPR